MLEPYADGLFRYTRREFVRVVSSDGTGEGISVTLELSEVRSDFRVVSLFTGIIVPEIKLLAPDSISATVDKTVSTDSVVRTQIIMGPTKCWISDF